MRHAIILSTLTLTMALVTGCPEEEEESIWEEVAYVDEGDVCHEATDGLVEVTVIAPDCLSSSCSRNVVGSCELTLDGTTLTLTSDIRWENDVSPDVLCTDDCGAATAMCELADVPDGTYILELGGTSTTIEVPGSSGEHFGCGY